ncbi:MAG: hypothetical protein CMC70_02020 [Flavobacteriaceae bacterium]|nr:hypothetical protein [Flavobacteriaceae bacterium]
MKTLTTLFICFLSLHLSAQKIEVAGTITDNFNLPLPYVNVVVKGTSQATKTDLEGNYAIKTQVGQTLVFSYVGFKTIEKPITKTSKIINLSMKVDAQALDEVVVTGYGIPREKKALGYAVSTLEAEAVESKPERKVKIALRGKVSGVKVEKTNSIPDLGLLTAAEINDIEKWDAWKKSVSSQEGKTVQQRWGFEYAKKIAVIVTDKQHTAIPNVKVALYKNNKRLFVATTDMEGRAILFKATSKSSPGDSYMIQLYNGGKIIGQPISRNKSEINITLKRNVKSPAKNVDVMFTIDATGSM